MSERQGQMAAKVERGTEAKGEKIWLTSVQILPSVCSVMHYLYDYVDYDVLMGLVRRLVG